MAKAHPVVHLTSVTWLTLGLGSVTSLLLTGCAGADTEENSALDEPALHSVMSVAQAQDNEPAHPDDGKTCYVDGPNVGAPDRTTKGKMRGGWCCVEQEDTFSCYSCTADHECQVAGGDVGVRVGPKGGFEIHDAPASLDFESQRPSSIDVHESSNDELGRLENTKVASLIQCTFNDEFMRKCGAKSGYLSCDGGTPMCCKEQRASNGSAQGTLCESNPDLLVRGDDAETPSKDAAENPDMGELGFGK